MKRMSLREFSKKGGSSKSPAKVEAAKANGKKGGRKPKLKPPHEMNEQERQKCMTDINAAFKRNGI